MDACLATAFPAAPRRAHRTDGPGRSVEPEGRPGGRLTGTWLVAREGARPCPATVDSVWRSELAVSNLASHRNSSPNAAATRVRASFNRTSLGWSQAR